MMMVIYLMLLFGTVYVDGQSDGVRIPAFEWYPNLFSLEVTEQIKNSDNIRCNLVTSAVKAALTMKKLTGSLTKSELVEAIGHFESCQEELCQNSAMLDQFMKPETFQEQINILIVKAKLPSMSKEEKKWLLRGLVNGKYHDDIYKGQYPEYSEESESKDTYQNMVKNVIETTCGSQPYEFAEYMRPNDVTTIFLFILIDRYTENAIDEQDGEDIMQAGLDHDKNEAWTRIAEQIFDENSDFASTCLDPYIGFYDMERHSVTRIREFAKAIGISCDKQEGFSAPPLASSIVGAAPGSSGGSSGGAPGSRGGGSSAGAPGSPGGSRSSSGFRP